MGISITSKLSKLSKFSKFSKLSNFGGSMICPKCGKGLVKSQQLGYEYCPQNIKVIREGPPYNRTARIEKTGCGILYQVPIDDWSWYNVVVPAKYVAWAEEGYRGQKAKRV